MGFKPIPMPEKHLSAISNRATISYIEALGPMFNWDYFALA